MPCSLVQLARVVIVRVILVDVVCVMLVVLIAHVDVVHVVNTVFVAIFLLVEMYSLHTPSVTVNCVSCYRNDHCNFCTKFFERLMPYINRRFTDFRRFPCSISVKSIVAVMSQMRDATRNLAIATKTRKSFATNFGSKLYPPLS